MQERKHNCSMLGFQADYALTECEFGVGDTFEFKGDTVFLDNVWYRSKYLARLGIFLFSD